MGFCAALNFQRKDFEIVQQDQVRDPSPTNRAVSVRCRMFSVMSELGQEVTFGEALLYISELIANCAARHLAARGGIASKISGGEAIERLPLSRRAVLYFFRVRCSANRSGDPIVAGKRPNTYAINYPELQAWIEMAHRPLIEVNDAARR